MILTLPTGHALVSDGIQWVLTDRPDGRPKAYFSRLMDAGHGMIARGIITEPDARGGFPGHVEAITQAYRAEQFTGGHAAAVERKAFLYFGGGRFALYPNQEGGWCLKNPTRDVARTGDAKEVVGCPASIRHAFLLAADRTFKAANGTVPYVDLNPAHLAATQHALADVVVRYAIDDPPCGCVGKCEGHPLKHYRPPIKATIVDTLTPEERRRNERAIWGTSRNRGRR